MTQKVFHLLDQATQAMDTNNYPALARVSPQIAALVPDNPYLAVPLLVIGQKLGAREDYLDAALKAVEVAADHAPPELKPEAVDTLARPADAPRRGPTFRGQVQAQALIARDFLRDS